MLPPDCTLVTCCFDLTQYNKLGRNLDDSINKMKSLLIIPCYLVIFTDNICLEKIKNIRGNLDCFTKYIINDFKDLNIYKYNEIVKKNRLIYHPTKDERTCSESHLICCNKFNFVLQIIESNPFNTTKFGWIDGNIGDNFSKICLNYDNNILLNILNRVTDKFHIQILNVCDKKFKDINLKKEMYDQYRWIVCGSLFTTGKDIGIKILNRLNQIFIETTILGYGHAEEMFYLEILDEFYDDIERSYGDYNSILNNFINPRIQYNYILNKIIRRYQRLGYYKECYECCHKLINEIENFNVQIDYNLYFLILFELYLCTYYYKNDKAKNVKLKILDLISKNPLIKCEYEKNKDFYNKQFSYIL